MLDTVLYNVYGFTSSGYLVHCCFLVLKVLINAEEVAHLIKDMTWKLGYILVHIVVRIAVRNSDYLLVRAFAIYHRYNAYRISSYEREWFKRLSAYKQNVERITVITVGARNKSVICGIMR